MRTTTPQLRIPRLRPDQSAIVRHPAKRKPLAMGRRWGKTVMSGALALTCAANGARVAWIAPTYRNSRPLWRFAESSVAHLRNTPLADISRSERIISFPQTLGFLGIYSGDSADSIRGENFHLVIIDEAARIAEEAYLEAIEPTVADTDGIIMPISTPAGKNWFWREWQRGQLPENQRFIKSWNAPTSANPSPVIRLAAERARASRPERVWLQEWMAQFLDEAGVFRYVYDRAIATPLAQGEEGRTYIYGCDWAGNSGQGDFTAYAVMDAERKTLVHLDRFHGTSYEQQMNRLLGLAQRFPPTAIVAEVNSMGGPVFEQLVNAELPMVPWVASNATKKVGVEALQLALEQGTITLLNDPVLVHEMTAYEASSTASGLVRYSAPEGDHDDCVMAVMMAWLGCLNSGPMLYSEGAGRY